METHGLPPAATASTGLAPLSEGVPALRVELRDRRITEATAALVSLLGCEAEDVVGRPLSDLWSAAERAAVTARFDDVVLLGRDAFGALAVQRDDAAPVLVDVDARFDYHGGQRLDVSLTPLPVPDGVPAPFPLMDPTSTGAPAPRDVAEAGTDDDATAAQVMVALGAAGASALHVRADGTVGSATRGAERLIGQSVARLRGRRFDRLFSLPSAADDALMAARLSGMRQTVRTDPDGALGEASLVLEWVPGFREGTGFAVLGDSRGAPKGGDTERLRLQAQLVSHVAHDLRDATASVYCALRTLVDALPPGTPEAETAADGLKESRRVNQIIDEVLAVSRPGRLRRVDLELAEALRETVKRYRSRAVGRSVEIHERLLPGVRVSADRTSLERAFGNLIDNALQATPHCGTLSVSSELEDRVGPGVRVSIADTGTGIPADLRPNVFEPFVTGKEDGSGLGLAITRRVVLDHGGQIDFESEEGRGTTFHVWLPRLT